jgi:hypothetical protein
MKNAIFCIFGLLLYLFFQSFMVAQKTEIQYISGTDCDNTVQWQFYCTEGQNSGKWSTIQVPSNWELQGYGQYNYGQSKGVEIAKEKGLYKHEFSIPSDWNKKQVDIVFEGSMTDTEVKINGMPAGPVHQGSFYRFSYDISGLLKYGAMNLLEVTVSKLSDNETVNNAERHGDYWVFGGIFRPVYLEAKPLENIIRTAIDAKADGFINMEVFLKNISSNAKVGAQVYTLQGKKVGPSFISIVNKGDSKVQLSGKMKNIKPWNPEDPNLYRVDVLLSRNGETIHETSTRFGFRTVEKRDRDGIYINGTKIKFKGVNRHTFWPETGRASSKRLSIDDVQLMKNMNMNAVRMSHYPPDSHFLDVCDSLGLFVLDELAGWHAIYDTNIGTQLVNDMVARDVNHPSIVLWDNGNEGGHNYDLDSVFTKCDIQKRQVIHPWQTFNGFDNQHYINYDYGAGTYWHGHEITFPTEFLHGLFDGGSGAGLYDYWELMWNNPRSAGGFLWVFADEGVVRTDRNGEIDVNGVYAPDGILGPFHEKEASYYAIKEIWSPVRFESKDITPDFDGNLIIENRYFFTNLNQCKFSYKLAGMPLTDGKSLRVEKSFKVVSPSILPGHKGQLKLDLPADWKDFDILYVTATDPYGRELYTWSWPITLPKTMVDKCFSFKGSNAGTITETDSSVTVIANKIEISISKKSGMLTKVRNDRGVIPFNNGPVLCVGKSALKELKTNTIGEVVQVSCTFADTSTMKESTWSIYPSGLVKLNVKYNPFSYDSDFLGVSFSYPESDVKAVKWLGNGPYRVWKNRMQGGTLDVHEKEYNNTITGVPPNIYPEFKGYHSQLYWARIIGKNLSFTVATSTEDVFLRLFTPEYTKLTYNTATSFPTGDISFLQAIPPIGTKSQLAKNLGPSGKQNMYFDYGRFDKWQLRCLKMDLFFDFSVQ